MDKLFELLREYCKEDIIMTNFYNPIDSQNKQLNEVLNYANKRLNELARIYDIAIVNINKIFLQRSNQTLNFYPTKKEYQEISKMICDRMYKTLLKK